MGNRWKRRWRFALRAERARPARSAAADFDEHDSYSGVMFANNPKGRMMLDAGYSDWADVAIEGGKWCSTEVVVMGVVVEEAHRGSLEERK